MRLATLLLAILLLPGAPVAAQQALDFLQGLNDFRDIEEMLPRFLNEKAFRLLDERQAAIDALSSPDDVAQRRDSIRRTILDSLGGLPERTPLQPKVVATIDRGPYQIEKILFESQPGFYVTANLYLPKTGTPPYPAVLYPLGHERGGKAYPIWQQMLGALAQKGYVALTWDPLGQGERSQFWDEDLKRSKLGSSTVEHTVLGIQCLLVGDSVAQYTIWDGIRALDYLLSRPEVDSTRVACTGNSGGGTHTAYLAALEDRIHVAAPSCYLTSWRKLLKTIGPQDAEQNLLPFLAARLDHADFVHAFAPRPFLILSAIRDFFPILGARKTFDEARQIYALLGAKEKIAMTDADDGHGYSKPRRMAAYDWFARWLDHDAAAGPEPEVEALSAQELWVTGTGQVATSVGGETVHSLNLKRAEQIQKNLPPVRDRRGLAAYREEIRNRVRGRTGYSPGLAMSRLWPFGVMERDGYRIEKLVFESEPGITIPGLLFVPEGGPAKKPATLWAHGAGKSADAGEGGDIEQAVRRGQIVLAIDLRGMGETRPQDARTGSAFENWFGLYDNAMTALQIGETLVGMRARDIVQGVDLLVARDDVSLDRVSIVGKDGGAVPALHAAVMDPRVAEVRLSGMLVSYDAVVRERLHQRVFENVVPGVLKSYDLPDLVAALAPRKVTLEALTHPMGSRAADALVKKSYARAREIYDASGAAANLMIDY